MVPCEDGKVAGRAQNLQLQPSKSVFSLPVQQRHVDLEHTEQTVSLVFDPRCLATGGPRHTPRCGIHFKLGLAKQECLRNACQVLYRLVQVHRRAKNLPGGGEEVQRPGGQQVLEGPAPGKPSARLELRLERTLSFCSITAGVLVADFSRLWAGAEADSRNSDALSTGDPGSAVCGLQPAPIWFVASRSTAGGGLTCNSAGRIPA